jgi:hypothetical protein
MTDKTTLKPDATLHSELLAELYNFMRKRTFIVGQRETVMDMVKRYQNPPLTMRQIVGMQMTSAEYQQLGALLKRISEALKA